MTIFSYVYFFNSPYEFSGTNWNLFVEIVNKSFTSLGNKTIELSDKDNNYSVIVIQISTATFAHSHSIMFSVWVIVSEQKVNAKWHNMNVILYAWMNTINVEMQSKA